MFLLTIACSFVLFSAIESRCVKDQLMGYSNPNDSDVILDRRKYFEQNELDEIQHNRLTQNVERELRRRVGKEESRNLETELVEKGQLELKRAVRDGGSKDIERLAIKKEGLERGDGKNRPMETQEWKLEHTLRDEEIEGDDKIVVQNEEFASTLTQDGTELNTVGKEGAQNIGLNALGHKESEKMEKKVVQHKSLMTKGSVKNEESNNTLNSLLGNKDFKLKRKIRDRELDSKAKEFVEIVNLRLEKMTGDEQSQNEEKRMQEIQMLTQRGAMGDGEFESNAFVENKASEPKQAKMNAKSKEKLLENKELELTRVITDGKLSRMDKRLSENIRSEVKMRTEDGKSENVENGIIPNKALELNTEMRNGESKTIERKLLEIKGSGGKEVTENGDLESTQPALRVAIRNGELDSLERGLTENKEGEPKSLTDGKSGRLENELAEPEGLNKERSWGDGESNALETLQKLQKRSQSDPDSWCFVEYYLCGLRDGTGEPHWKSEEHRRNFYKRMEDAAAQSEREGKTYRSPTRGRKQKKKSIWKTFKTWCSRS